MAIKFDLEERTKNFSIEIIRFVKELPKSEVNLPLVRQLIRATTSIGANYCEANNAESRKDFIHKIGICKKEAKETKYWLSLIKEASGGSAARIDDLINEATELTLILSAISNNTKSKSPI